MIDRPRRARVRNLGIAGAFAGAGLCAGLAVVAAHTGPGRPAPATDQSRVSDAGQVLQLRPPGALPVPTAAPPAATTGGS